MADEPREVLTIGHSSHKMEHFLALLREAGVTAVADVRSAPHSRHVPQFNHDTLKAALRDAGIAHVYLGKELGGRPQSKAQYRDGVADYEKIAASDAFQAGLQRVLDGAATHRIALMCAEQFPQDCHRCLLIGRALAARGVRVCHLLPDGSTATQANVESDLLRRTARDKDDLFLSESERVALAYREYAHKVAFTAAAEQERTA
ncbi:MAG TPA: DUF488 domain-containing protein [Acetobacteraceae bacterium]|jgi:uncharacterized protein (DUF488 family)|nr:DUF488 domain-containing protein [Acetobacteraceae bacterium]